MKRRSGRDTTRPLSGASAYSIAVGYGYPYIRGDGVEQEGAWLGRFTKNPSGEEPAIYVGFKGDRTNRPSGRPARAIRPLPWVAAMKRRGGWILDVDAGELRSEPRIRFNWGYHDGAHDVRRRGQIASMAGHFDKMYAAGYLVGVDDAKRGEYTGDSTRAWLARRRPGRRRR